MAAATVLPCATSRSMSGNIEPSPRPNPPLVFFCHNVLLFVPLKLDALVVPFVFIVNDTVPFALLTNVLKSNVAPVNIVPVVTVIVASAFTAFTVTVAVAAFTVVLPALLAVITLVPLPATAFIVAPFVPLHVNTLVVPLVNVIGVPGVPPLPAFVADAVTVLLYFIS